MMEKRLLIAEDEKSLSQILAELFTEKDYRVDIAADGLSAWEALQKKDYGVALVDIKMPGLSGLEVLSQAKKAGLKTQFIVMTAQDTMENTIEAIKGGALDYLAKPFELAEVEKLVDQAWALWEQTKTIPDREIKIKTHPQRGFQLIGKSKAIKEIYKNMGRVALSQVPVLITGESGTGKELVARAIHHYSSRQNAPFVAVNCAAIPKDLLESELFGHAKGAFTGATEKRVGYFEQAQGGTLFLDEVGELPLELQAKLLRVLQSGEVQALGESQSKRLDLRLLAATNRRLEEEVSQGRFREDLYFRLHVFPLELPPLRKRPEDITLLAEFFLKELAKEMGGHKRQLSQKLIKALGQHPWPGNVRQLENTLKRALLLSTHQKLDLKDFDFFFKESPPRLKNQKLDLGESIESWTLAHQQENELYTKFLNQVERPFLRSILKKHRGRQLPAAKQLGINRNTLRKKLKDLGLGQEN